MVELHENLDILILMDSWSFNFDDRPRMYTGILVMEIYFQFTMYYIIN
jgi:hypothetical protein